MYWTDFNLSVREKINTSTAVLGSNSVQHRSHDQPQFSELSERKSQSNERGEDSRAWLAVYTVCIALTPRLLKPTILTASPQPLSSAPGSAQ
jgi:hypothetical protein